MRRWAGAALAAAVTAAAAQTPDAAPPLTVYAAGSLRAALTRIGADFEAAPGGQKVTFVFGASGLLRDRLLGGERADVFITYCTNAVAARQEVPALQVLAVPEAINVSARYGLAVLRNAAPAAQRFVDFVLGPAGQQRLAAVGSSAPN
jgi:ABC-type molybdate transport system substrate-binding protein